MAKPFHIKNFIIFFLGIFYFTSTILAQSSSATYTVSDLPTGDNVYDPTCNGPLTPLIVNIPPGANVTSIDVAYDMTATAAGGGWMSEQESQLFCQETAQDEGGDASGAGAAAGTFSYNRTGLTLGNGISATGVLTFEMRAYRTWSGVAGCNAAVNKVDNNTWTIIVNYTNPIPMVYVSSTSTQNNSSDVPTCSANQNIIGFEVVMDGGLNLIDLTQIQMDMTGTTAITDLANIDVFYTGTNSTFTPINLFGSATPTVGTITLNGVQTLAAGVNYFWIAYDVAASPTIGNLLDAQCSQITIDGSTFAPTITTPVGSRTIGVCAGTPGGITNNLTLWLDGTDGANNGVAAATNGGSVDAWINRSGNPGCPELNQGTAAQMPTFKTNALNFNPVVSFDGTNDQLSRSVLGSDMFGTTNNTIFFVHKYYSGTVYFKWEQGSSGNRVGYENSGGFTRFDYPTDAAGNQNIGTFGLDPLGQIVTATTDASNSVLRNMGLQNATNPITGNLNTTFTSDLSIGENVTFSIPSEVDFAEVIIFNETLSAVEQNKVESYLAIKYGMTLGINGTSLNYNSSAGTVIWDAGLNIGYNFDIGGVSRDDLTDQDQRKSKSINQNLGIDRSILTVANGTNFSNPTLPVSDLTHFIWGNNDAATNFSNVATFSTVNGNNVDAVLDRYWKSQETGGLGVVTLHFDMTTATNITNWSKLTLLVDGDGDFTTGATSFAPSLIDSTGILSLEFEHDFSNADGFFFTLAETSIPNLEIDNPLPVVECDSFTLVPITGSNVINPQYYTGSLGTGTPISVGTVITADTIIYLYDETGGSPNVFDEDTLTITILNAVNSTDVQTACGNFVWINGTTYNTTNNTATHTIAGGASNGCDSIVALDLTINTFAGTDTQTDCNSFTWANGDGNTYTTTNNTATHTIIGGAITGCDSIVTLNLTIINSTNGTDVQAACSSFTWANGDGNTYTTTNNTATHTIIGGSTTGCDSIVTLNLTITNSTNGTDAQTACSSFTWANGDGNTYTTTNNTATYTISGGAASGCDSIVTLDLTFDTTLLIDLGEDIYSCDELITLSPGNGYSTYTWNTNETESSVIINDYGLYTVEVMDIDGCIGHDEIEIIKECPYSLWVPNAFSPNGDDRNEVFNPVGYNLKSFSLKVFNRWGNLLFETNTIGNGMGWNL